MSFDALLGRLWDFLKNKFWEGKDKPKQLGPPNPTVRQSAENSQSCLCACLLLGYGGAGKTTLIRSMFGGSAAKPNIETKAFRLHKFSALIDDASYSVVITDYRGQDSGQITEGMTQPETLKEIRREQFNAVVLTLDICATRDAEGRPVPGTPVPDFKRLKQNVETWSNHSLGPVLGVVERENVRFALVFVNKIDVLTGSESREHCKKIEQICERLKAELARRLPFADVSIRLGSARAREATDTRDDLLRIARMS